MSGNSVLATCFASFGEYPPVAQRERKDIN
jgi:hypothetical protein